ncbi:MAG: acetylglutamate kinase [Candidatus Poribacteria bacterium]|nr:acetylglutamate kinase [Candidatus Poribacteria bacterium]
MDELVKKADILIEALPYIRRFSGKTVVIKYGGAAMTEESLKHSVMQDIVLMKYVGMHPVVVHGGGDSISEWMGRIGKKAEFVQGLRVTDKETVEIAEMVLAGRINKGIVSLINQHGGKAVGLCGKDANLIRAQKHFAHIIDDQGEPAVVDLGFVGDIVEVNPEVIITLDREGYIPVIAPNGVGEDGYTYNINADTMAGEIAAALKAEKLILLTDQQGILRNLHDPSTLMSTIKSDQIELLIDSGVISTGMLPKVEACVTALKGGVSKTHIIDGRISHAILLEVFTAEGIGTEIVAEKDDLASPQIGA